jgi:diguanylate cyclase (GGDEF)-like protein
MNHSRDRTFPPITAIVKQPVALPAVTPPAAAREPRPRADAASRTYLLALVLATIAFVAALRLDLHVEPASGWALPFWALALLTIGCAFMVFDVEFRRETYTFTFSEVVLVIGLFFASPLHFIAGRLLGELVFLSLRERQAVRKLVTNLAVYFIESVVLLTIQQALRPALDIQQPAGWLVALIAVIGAELVGYAAIATVIRWHGGPITLQSIMRIGLMTAPANTSLALVICVLLDAQPAAVPLLGGVAVFLVVMYRAYSSLRQRFDSLSLLYDFTHLVSGAREPDEVLDAMLSQAKNLLRAERAEFWLALDDGGFRRHVVDDGGHTSTRQPLPTALARVVRELDPARESMVIPREAHEAAQQAVLAALRARDALLAPILEGDSLVGFVVVADRLSDIYTFGSQDARMFATLASHAGVALQNGRLIVRLHEQARQREHEALHDPLTGLPNRVQFGEWLERRLAHADLAPIGIALMDLDGFKEINDTLGHQTGDAVLIGVARRLLATVAPDTLVVRLGGDEFAMLAPPGMERDELEAMCRRIRTELAVAMSIDSLSVNMGASIGIAVAPTDGRDVDTLLRRADVAMYAAKAGRGGGVCVYEPDRDENTPRRLALTNDIRTAVEGGQLAAVYQPKVSLLDGRITGVECLCRWNHPVFGLVMPDEFIPLADRTGAIVSITAFMMATALEQCERWATSGRDWGVAINVSMRNLLDHELVTRLARLLESSPVPPGRITLEITETYVMSDAVRTTRILEELASLGVRLSIDDFGTGYSSLAYLQRLAVDEVKIDKSFVVGLGTKLGAEAIVRSVIDLARNLDLRVVAEGVETGEAAARLRDLGCHEAQGFYFARPMAADELEAIDRLAPNGLAPNELDPIGMALRPNALVRVN